ncbi:branched-chain amino acid ABC transporter permease [Bordetella pseudohinzii]|uniref:ABC transporter permease n=1 Tax=Bordetella pseudohinzii TaxID=1331258 RepID=A0A0J6BU68_9BORD|nr:branched-chain amino acid ABC transporter permease [Bordetella pseudohinzii]ANY16146.1 ABC transporter permease [Bordetella pseudohinzii]KMM25369.1 ABC transporter permease [Bordetella pseudohinzii]KXA76548.1 ABC transporter permease [Bordetella pseudohinzii]KXA81257.1 ABC transporter permease [Bordetella pseudohinzii]CUJ03952.1 LIV-I protein H [Bordetella pseudohinzii]
MSLDLLPLALVDGIAYASLLFLVSMGLTLVFGVMGILNVAHGAFYAFGGYTAASFVMFLAGRSESSVLLFLALFAAAIVVGLALGTVLEFLLIRRAQHYDPVLKLLLTFGAFLMLEDIQRAIWGAQPYSASEVVNRLGNIELGDITYTTYQLVVVPVTALLAYVALEWFLKRTKLGKQTVAMTHHREVATSLGINAKKIGLVTFVIATMLGALGGALAAPTTSLVPGAGTDMTVLSFAVVATAGLGQITGALIAALLIGVARAIAVYMAPELEVAVPYIIMVLVLIIRPHGLFTVAQARTI